MLTWNQLEWTYLFHIPFLWLKKKKNHFQSTLTGRHQTQAVSPFWWTEVGQTWCPQCRLFPPRFGSRGPALTDCTPARTQSCRW